VPRAVVTDLTVVSWNVLAAPWAAPAFYPATMDPAVLDRDRRRRAVAARLAELDADLVCLQETTTVDLAVVVELLGDGFRAHEAPNHASLWAGWATEELAWEPNGTAIIWRADRFDDVHVGALALSADGNAATTFRARVAGIDVVLRAVSIHLDVDEPGLRRAQLPVALTHFAAGAEAVAVDVVAGDCNEDTNGTELGAITVAHGFADALTAVGDADPTHPLARPDDHYAPMARLDHVLVRGATPVAGRVVDAEVRAIEDPNDRWIEGMRRTGSDHFAVVATVAVGG
jgi:endonuclease/exonuclease/phosphatase family metal-dependent hydrolase